MPLLFMSHKILYFALCSTHSVLIFDNYIILMVLTLICMQIFSQISFCSILTSTSKLILCRHLNIFIFPSHPHSFRNMHLILLPLQYPHYPNCSCSKRSFNFFSFYLAYSVNCHTLFSFWKVVLYFLPKYKSFPSIRMSLYLALFLSVQSVCPVHCH